MTPTLRRLALPAAALGVGASRFLARSRVPEDYDAVGFVRALDDFDLPRLQPAPPGYPVFVALGRVAHLVVPSALDAAVAVSALASAVTAAAVWRVAATLGGARAGWIALGLYAVAWLPWLLGGAPLADATATAWGALACAALLAPACRPVLAGGLVGTLVGAMLGTRLSYAPIGLSLIALVHLHHGRRALAAAIGGAAAATAAWLAPVAALVGGARLLSLSHAHLVGHFTTWGGSIATRPDPGARLLAFTRALLYDGVAPSPALAVACALVVTVAALRRVTALRVAPAAAASEPARAAPAAAAPDELAPAAPDARAPRAAGRALAPVAAQREPARRSRRRGHPLRDGVLLAVPYAGWVLLGQNILVQPRHALPLVVMLLVAAALLVAPWPRSAISLIMGTVLASAPLASARRSSLPAARQAVDHLAARHPAGDLALFGGASIRLVDDARPGFPTRARGWLAEVDVDLARLDVLPPHVYVTSEVEPDAARAARLVPGPRLCRDARIDRAMPCLQLFEYRLPGARP